MALQSRTFDINKVYFSYNLLGFPYTNIHNVRQVFSYSVYELFSDTILNPTNEVPLKYTFMSSLNFWLYVAITQ